MDQPGVALILLAGGAHSKSMDYFFLKYPDYIHAYVSFPSSLTKRCFSLVCKKKKVCMPQRVKKNLSLNLIFQIVRNKNLTITIDTVTVSFK